MDAGQLLNPEQINDPKVSFASVYCLTSVTVHISLLLPQGKVGGLPVVQHPVTCLAVVAFFHMNRTPK